MFRDLSNDILGRKCAVIPIVVKFLDVFWNETIVMLTRKLCNFLMKIGNSPLIEKAAKQTLAFFNFFQCTTVFVRVIHEEIIILVS